MEDLKSLFGLKTPIETSPVQKEEAPKEKNYTRRIFILLSAVTLIFFLAILKATKSFSIQIFLSILLALIALPAIRKLHSRFRLPWSVGILISLIAFILLISGFARLLQASAESIINAYPRYEDRLLALYKYSAAKFNLSFDEGKTLIENLLAQLKVRQYLQSAALSVSNTALMFTKNLFVIFLMYTFLLVEAGSFEKKISLAFEGKMRHRVRSVIAKVIVDTTSYISIKFIISLATGVVVFTGLSIIGVDFAVVWAFLAFLLNFIPTFGSVISFLVTVFFALLQFFPSVPQVLATALVMLLTNMLLGNIVEPRVEGGNLDISPFLILVSLSVWGWIWGFIGMILAVPFLVFIKIFCENVSFLKPMAIMLGNNKTK
ncbi:MAG: AI-2E family transporter [Treponema sp.]|nr:AI-2E family transporter [Treponema sp.]